LPGVGLILLRLAVAVGAIFHGVCRLIASSGPTPILWATGLLECLIGGALLIGFLTPVAGCLATVANTASGASVMLASGLLADARAATSIILAVMSLALVLLGPGAFSLDARIFGRREIIIPAARHTPRS
jgi:uncharacterized membrane protein YphA (DoxX/SURF4 family)